MKRSLTDLRFDTLRILDEGIHSPTRIFFSTNTSWTLSRHILEFLERNGQARRVRKSDYRTEWFITEEGRRRLRLFQEALK